MSHRIEDQWMDFRARVVPVDAPAEQLMEMRRAFYAGAEALLRVVLTGLAPCEDSTPEDEKLMDEIDAELAAFAELVAMGVA